jgi:ribose transport system permease protein
MATNSKGVHGARKSALVRLGLDRFSGIYVLVILVGVFWFTNPDVFPTNLTLRTTLSDNAVIALLALGALLSFAAGLVDLSFASYAGLSLVTSTWMSINTHLPGPVVMVLMVIGGAALGMVSGLFVTLLGVNSLVVTLGMATVALGLAELVSGNNTLTANWSPGFQKIGQGYVGSVPYPFTGVLILGVAIYYLLEFTAVGRRILAVGYNPSAAQLVGLRVNRIRMATLVASGAIAGFAGVVLSAQLGSATTATGPAYLLPAVAALFLGETQIRRRVNVWGTLLAALLVGVGIKGLQLQGIATWVNQFFDGAVLLLAVGVAARSQRSTRA